VIILFFATSGSVLIQLKYKEHDFLLSFTTIQHLLPQNGAGFDPAKRKYDFQILLFLVFPVEEEWFISRQGKAMGIPTSCSPLHILS
jgi:hypothetical protein